MSLIIYKNRAFTVLVKQFHFNCRYIATNKYFSVHSSWFAMDDKRALNLALRFMSMAGQQPHVNNWYSKMNTCVLISCIVILWPIIIIKMLTNLDDVDILVLSLESMLTLYQVGTYSGERLKIFSLNFGTSL